MDRKQRMNDLINELVTKKTTNKDCYVARIDGRLFETKRGKSNDIITELGNRLNWIKV